MLAGAVILLRNAGTPSEQREPPPPPAQTTVREQADEGVLLPRAGGRPARPQGLTVVPGPRRLQVRWEPRPDASGYDVRLSGQRPRFVTASTIQFNGLDNEVEHQVEVRAVDAFGQRSEPVTSRNRPTNTRPDESRYALVDHFDGPVVPDPARWRLANKAACARMGRGTDADRARLVISAACGPESVALRSRTPLRLKENAGELGRMMVETDATDLALTLVPGPVDLIDTPPPGSVMVQIAGGKVTLPGQAPITVPSNGLSVRWELVLRTDGLQLWRDGNLVGSAAVVPTWAEATPLVSFTGPANGLNYVGIDAIGLSSADTPQYVPTPTIVTVATDTTKQTPMTGVLGGQVRITVEAGYGTVYEPFAVELSGRRFPARPAVDGQVWEPGGRFPLVADVPADALVLTGSAGQLPLTVRVGDRRTVVQHLGLELTPDPAASRGDTPWEGEPVRRPFVVLAAVSGVLLNAAGEKIESGAPSPRGRVVLEVTAAGEGDLAGLAGIEIRVDGRRIAGIPVNLDGPGIAGKWRLALNTGAFQPGVRNLEIKAISTEPGTPPQLSTTVWQISA